MAEHPTTHPARSAAIPRRRLHPLALAAAAGILCACADGSDAATVDPRPVPGAAGAPYPHMPATAPIGVRTGRYLDVPESARGPALPPGRGYRLQELGSGLYMVTDNAYQSMFLVHDSGVVVVDAPPSYAAHIPKAIAEVTDLPITHLVYSHSHADHIGGAKALGGSPSSSRTTRPRGC